MPVREKRRETTAGLFVLIGLLLLGGLILEFGRIGAQLKDQYSLFVEFTDTAGIIKNSAIRLRGAKVGRVANTPELIIEGNSSFVQMELTIDDEVKIPKGSLFQIGSSGLMGDKYIEIIPSAKATDQFYTSGDHVKGDSSGDFDAIKSNAENIARDASQLIQDAKITIDKVDNALESIKTTSDNLNISLNKVNQQFLSEKNIVHFSTIMQNFESSSTNLRDASHELKPTLAEVRSTVSEVRSTVTEARTALTNIQKSTETALEDIPSAVKSIDRAAAEAEKTISSFQSQDSLAGTLTNDKETGDNAKDFLKNLKRYGILRYRDDDAPELNDPRNKYRGSRR